MKTGAGTFGQAPFIFAGLYGPASVDDDCSGSGYRPDSGQVPVPVSGSGLPLPVRNLSIRISPIFAVIKG